MADQRDLVARAGRGRPTSQGDQITLVGHPMRDGSKGISPFYAIKDGKKMYHDIARPKEDSSAN